MPSTQKRRAFLQQSGLRVGAGLSALSSLNCAFRSKLQPNLNPAGAQSTRVLAAVLQERPSDPARLAREARAFGINHMFLSPALLESNTLRHELEREDIATVLRFPVLFDAATKQNPELCMQTPSGQCAHEQWMQLVCPSQKDFLEQKAEALTRATRRFTPAAVLLEYVHHFSFWEQSSGPPTVQSCFDEACIEAFSKTLPPKQAANIPEKPSDKDKKDKKDDSDQKPSKRVAYIQNQLAPQWARFRRQQITKLSRQMALAVRAGCSQSRVWLQIVPWRQRDFQNAAQRVVAQELPELAQWVDGFCPMTWHHVLGHPPAWIASVLRDQQGQIPAQPSAAGPGSKSITWLSSVQVAPAYREKTVAPEAIEAAVDASRFAQGLIFWHWEQLLADRRKWERAQKALRRPL